MTSTFPALTSLQQALQSRPIGVAARIAAVIILVRIKGSAGVGLAANVSFCDASRWASSELKILLEPLIVETPGIHSARPSETDLEGSVLHVTNLLGLIVRGGRKFLGPFQRVPVMAKATFDRLAEGLVPPGKAIGKYH